MSVKGQHSTVFAVCIGILSGDPCRDGKPPADESAIVYDQVQQVLHRKMTLVRVSGSLGRIAKLVSCSFRVEKSRGIMYLAHPTREEIIAAL